jgi:hypothetical protein
MKTLAPTIAVACACVFALIVALTPQHASATTKVVQRTDLRDEIEAARTEAWRWQRVMGMRPTSSGKIHASAGLRYQRWALNLWQARARVLRVRASHPPHRDAFLCIQSYEGPWTAATGNGYYGGLQMDISFQRRYGAKLFRVKGTADHWTPLEQIWVAERAHASGRGFGPWPNTARACGVL